MVTTINSVTIEDLDNGISYAFVVRAICEDEVDTSEWSLADTLSTLIDDVEIAELNSVSALVYPNPANKNINFEFSQLIAEGALKIYNVIEKKCISKLVLQIINLTLMYRFWIEERTFIR